MAKKFERTAAQQALHEARLAQRLSQEEASRKFEAEARSKREEEIQQERALPAVASVFRTSGVAVVELKGSNSQYFLDGFAGAVEKGLKGSVEYVPANGTIQGDENKLRAHDAHARISRLRRDHPGRGVLVFLGYNFADKNSTGTAMVNERLEAISGDIGILVTGKGRPEDLIAQPTREQSPIAGLLAVRFAILPSRELTTDPTLGHSLGRTTREDHPSYYSVYSA